MATIEQQLDEWIAWANTPTENTAAVSQQVGWWDKNGSGLLNNTFGLASQWLMGEQKIDLARATPNYQVDPMTGRAYIAGERSYSTPATGGVIPGWLILAGIGLAIFALKD